MQRVIYDFWWSPTSCVCNAKHAKLINPESVKRFRTSGRILGLCLRVSELVFQFHAFKASFTHVCGGLWQRGGASLAIFALGPSSTGHADVGALHSNTLHQEYRPPCDRESRLALLQCHLTRFPVLPLHPAENNR